MPICPTKYHGDLAYPEGAELAFPHGLFGFESETRFLALELPSARPIVFLQSLITRDLCFVTLPIFVVDPGYRLALAKEDLELLGLPAETQPRIGEGILCLALLTVQERQPTTANLLAPVVIHLENRRGVQAISLETGYSHQHVFLAPREESLCS